MQHKGTVTLKTQRLILRRFAISDADEMFQNWAGDSRVTKHLSWPHHKNTDVTRTVLGLWEASYIKDGYYHWGIVFENRLVGSIDVLNIDEANHGAEVGYCIGYRYWNRGIVSEAMAAVIRFLFEEVGLHRICAKHAVGNPASGRVMQKCGMVKEGVLRGTKRYADGSYADTVLYSILRGELGGHLK